MLSNGEGSFKIIKLHEIDFLIVAEDASKPSVSWLKFEPKVSNFPLI